MNYLFSPKPHSIKRYNSMSLLGLLGLLCILCLMISGCEESGNSINSTSDFGISGSSKVSNQGLYMWSAGNPLMPSGDPTVDTEALQEALLDSRMNEGGTLYLGPGVFYVNSPIVRQSFEPTLTGYSSDLFVGTIKGSGKGVTIIKSVRGPGDTPFGTFFDLPATFMVWDFDYFGIYDLTFEAESEIADTWEFPTLPPTKGLLSYINLGSGMYGVGGEIGTDCINVHFKGSLDSEGNPEIPLLWECFGGGSGVHNMKSCDFENGNFVMMDYGYLDGATINIGGNASDKNTYVNNSDLHIYAINAYEVGDCDITISNVCIDNSGGFGFWAHSDNTKSTLSFYNNQINMMYDSWFAGVELWVEPGWGELSARVSNNNIHSEDAFIFGPIFSEGVQDLIITNNRFTGRGSAATYIGALMQWPGTVKMIGNNFQLWENTGINQWGFEAAPIWLGPNITNSLVVGGNNIANVFDEPGDEPKNNIFTGVNNMQVNIGQEIRDAMMAKLATHQRMIARTAR